MVTIQEARQQVAQQRAQLETQKQLVAGQKLQVQSQLAPQPSRSTLLNRAGGIMQKIKTGIQQVAFGQQKDTALQQVGTYEQSLKAQEQQLQDYETQIAQAEQQVQQVAGPNIDYLNKIVRQKDIGVRNLMIRDLSKADRKVYYELEAGQKIQQSRIDAANILQPLGINFKDITPETLKGLSLPQLQTLEKAKLISMEQPQVQDIQTYPTVVPYSRLDSVDQESVAKLYGRTPSGNLITAGGKEPYIVKNLTQEQLGYYADTTPQATIMNKTWRNPQSGDVYVGPTAPAPFYQEVKPEMPSAGGGFISNLKKNIITLPGNILDLPRGVVNRGTKIYDWTADTIGTVSAKTLGVAYRRGIPVYNFNLVSSDELSRRNQEYSQDLISKKYGWTPTSSQYEPWYKETGTNIPGTISRNNFNLVNNPVRETFGGRTGTLSVIKSSPVTFKDTTNFIGNVYGGIKGAVKPLVNNPISFLPTNLAGEKRFSGVVSTGAKLYGYSLIPNPVWIGIGGTKLLSPRATSQERMEGAFILGAIGTGQIVKKGFTKKLVGTEKGRDWYEMNLGKDTDFARQWNLKYPNLKSKAGEFVDSLSNIPTKSKYERLYFSPKVVRTYQSPIGKVLHLKPTEIVQSAKLTKGIPTELLEPGQKYFISGQKKVLFQKYVGTGKKVPYEPTEGEAFGYDLKKSYGKLTNPKLNIATGTQFNVGEINKLPKVAREMFFKKGQVYVLKETEKVGLGKSVSIDLNAAAKGKLKYEVSAIASREVPKGFGVLKVGNQKIPVRFHETSEVSKALYPEKVRLNPNYKARATGYKNTRGIMADVYLPENAGGIDLVTGKLSKTDLRSILRAKGYEQKFLGLSSREGAVKTFVNTLKNDFQTTTTSVVSDSLTIPKAPLTLSKARAVSKLSSPSLLGIPRMVGGLGLTQTQINQSAYKPVPEFWTDTITKARTDTALKPDVITKSRSGGATMFDTTLKTNTDIILKPKDDVIIRDIVIQKPGVVQKPKLGQLQRLGTRQKSKLRSGMGFPPPPPPIKIKIPPPPLPDDDFRKGSKGKGKGLFVAEIRRRGKFKPIGEPSPFFKAVSTGKRAVGETLGASLRIRKYKTGEIVPLSPSGFFGPSKRETGVLVQRAGARLSSWGERAEIKQSRRKIRW